MTISDLDLIIKKAVDSKKIIELNYIRLGDGVVTCRQMEPYDVSPGKRNTDKKLMFWGKCLDHDRRTEQKLPNNIISVTVTEKDFIPEVFNPPAVYRIPRNW